MGHNGSTSWPQPLAFLLKITKFLTKSSAESMHPICIFWTYIYSKNMIPPFPVYQSQLLYKVFKNGPDKICGRQSLKNLKWYSLFKQTTSDDIATKCACLPQSFPGLFLNTSFQIINQKHPVISLEYKNGNYQHNQSCWRESSGNDKSSVISHGFVCVLGIWCRRVN